MMKNYENRLKAIKKIADGKQVDINTVKADVIIIDDIPESVEGSDIGNESDG